MANIRALTLATTTLVAMAAPLHAYAQCTIDSPPNPDDTASNPPDGVTITCEDNLDSDGVVNRQANNVTVNILAPSGGISVTGQAGIALGDNATIDIAGGSNRPVNTSGDVAPGITVGNGARITVGGQVATSGGNSPAIETGDDATVDISGTVRTGGGTSDAVSVGANSEVTVRGGGRVTTGNSMSDAIVLRGDNATATIESDAVVTTSSGMSNPIQVDGNMGTVNVSGDVRSSSGDATAILINGDDAMVTIRDGGFVTAQSSGSNGIESTGMGATIRVERGGEVRISSGNSSAIVSGVMGTVEIAGTVSASSSQSQGVVLDDGASLTIEEMGVISTSSSESQAVLVTEGAMEATITVNAGGEIDAVGAQAIVDRGMTSTTVTVDGRIFGGSSDPVLDMGAGNDEVTVNGTVEGSSASPVIDMGDGMDTLTINSSTTVEGPDVLANMGAGMDTLNLNSGQTFESSQFRGAETVNVNSNTLQGDPNNGQGTTYNVTDNQSGQTVNTGSNSSTNVESGGSVGTVNSSGQGSTTNVNSGGSAESTNASDGGTTNVNEGGSVGSASSDGAGSSTNVNSGGMAGNVSATNGGQANVNAGGMASNSSAGSGGLVTVANGGNGGRVQSDMGGTVTVQSGGSANVDSGSGNGGQVNLESGSNANVMAGASARRQFTAEQGFNISSGSNLTLMNSVFLSAQDRGDGTQDIGLGPDAFRDGAAAQGVTNANSLSAASGLDAIIAANTDNTAIDALGGIVLTQANEVGATFEQVASERSVQTASGALFAAGQFTDLLRAGANPLSGTAYVSTGSYQVAGPLTPLSGYDDGDAGVWVAATYGQVDVEEDNFTPLEAETTGFAAGVEGRIDALGADEGAAGIGIGYSRTDLNSASIPEGDVSSWSVGAYAGGTYGAVRADAALSYTRSDIEDLDVDESANVWNGRVELAFDVFGDANSGVNVSPLLRASGTLASFNDFEPVGPVGTTFEDNDFEQGVLGAGARVGFTGGGLESRVRVHAEAAYERVVGDRNLAFAATVGQTAGAFDIVQRVADKDRVHLGGGIGIEATDRIAVGLRYDGRFGSKVDDHRGSLRATLKF